MCWKYVTPLLLWYVRGVASDAAAASARILICRGTRPRMNIDGSLAVGIKLDGEPRSKEEV